MLDLLSSAFATLETEPTTDPELLQHLMRMLRFARQMTPAASRSWRARSAAVGGGGVRRVFVGPVSGMAVTSVTVRDGAGRAPGDDVLSADHVRSGQSR